MFLWEIISLSLPCLLGYSRTFDVIVQSLGVLKSDVFSENNGRESREKFAIVGLKKTYQSTYPNPLFNFSSQSSIWEKQIEISKPYYLYLKKKDIHTL